MKYYNAKEVMRFTTQLSLALLSALLVLMEPVAFFPLAVALCLVTGVQWYTHQS